jgi:hypothetical protein
LFGCRGILVVGDSEFLPGIWKCGMLWGASVTWLGNLGGRVTAWFACAELTDGRFRKGRHSTGGSEAGAFFFFLVFELFDCPLF